MNNLSIEELEDMESRLTVMGKTLDEVKQLLLRLNELEASE